MNDTMKIEEQFLSAVEIIRTLPKSGFVKPSNDTKLKFYSFFKQATEGPCELPKPGFWDIINRAKWEAWNKLGHMSKEEAMKSYVQAFVETLQQYSLADLEDPEVLNEYTSLMGPFIEYAPKEFQDCFYKRPLNNNHSADASNGINGHDSDSDEFSDTLDQVIEPFIPETTKTKGPPIVSVRGGVGESRKTGGSGSGESHGRGNRPPRQPTGPNQPSLFPRTGGQDVSSSGGGGDGEGGPSDLQGEVKAQLAMAIIRMQHTMEQVVTRLESLEELIKRKASPPSWGINPKLALLILAWPFIAQWIIYMIRKRQRNC